MSNFIANITFELKSPLRVGSSDIDFLLDSPVQKDWNALPMILGTSIAGALRSKFTKNEKLYDLFGDDILEQSAKEEDAKGSRLIISNALLCDENMSVCEELLLDNQKSEFLKSLSLLPIRNHNRINEKGVVETTGKFDEEIVLKGSRFKFRVEIIDGEMGELSDIILTLKSKNFRLGGGSSNGFGEIKILDELSSWAEFSKNSKEYQNTTSSLNETLPKSLKELNLDENLSVLEKSERKLTKYTLNLKADDFFMFGSGFGDLEADNTQVKERVVVYENGKATIKDEVTILPASSIKGALAHRSVYHLNLLKGKFIGDSEIYRNLDSIFGVKKDDEELNEGEKNSGKKGSILISDLFLEKTSSKVFDHVAIDRFSGGAIESALFQEKAESFDREFRLEILLDGLVEDTEQKAFENALNDICNGMLGLGGTTTKGHGFFDGELLKDSENITKKGVLHGA